MRHSLNFRSVPRLPTKSFDGRGNYSLGITGAEIFRRVDYDRSSAFTGWTSRRNGAARSTPRWPSAELGMPFRVEPGAA